MKATPIALSTFLSLPFPALAARTGDCGLWDAYLRGIVSRAATGETFTEEQIPLPDDATAAYIAALRAKKNLSEDEKSFLDYASAAEAAMEALKQMT